VGLDLSSGRFATTQWSDVLAARDAATAEALLARESLGHELRHLLNAVRPWQPPQARPEEMQWR
jgi:hypothetical protein